MKPINEILAKCPDVELDYQNLMSSLNMKINNAKDEHHYQRFSDLILIKKCFDTFVLPEV